MKKQNMDHSKNMMILMLVVLAVVGVVVMYAMNLSTENRSGAYQPTVLTDSYVPSSLDMDVQLLENNLNTLETLE